MQNPYFISRSSILDQVRQVRPDVYIRNRNYLDGDVTRLSPFITHGAISVADLARQALASYSPKQIEKFLFQLAWREFFHRVWQARGDDVFADIKHVQPNAAHDILPTAIQQGETGVDVLDETISELVDTGYLHNHARMWIAATACNTGRTRWQAGARWMYYHLLDGDLASNSLSWQWVAGSFSNKTYIANQDNLNKYARTGQRDTFLDLSYPQLAERDVPDVLMARSEPLLENCFPDATVIEPISNDRALLLYHPFNLDPEWRKAEDAQRVLVIEPDSYRTWPLGQRRWEFIVHLASQVPNLKIHVGSLGSLIGDHQGLEIISREYPLTAHWPGARDPRDWLFPEVEGDFPSFFKFWNKARKSTMNSGD